MKGMGANRATVIAGRHAYSRRIGSEISGFDRSDFMMVEGISFFEQTFFILTIRGGAYGGLKLLYRLILFVRM
jgi:hypothetical protein